MKTIQIYPGTYKANQDTVNKYRLCKDGKVNVKKGDVITVVSVDNDENLVECAETVFRMDVGWFLKAFDRS